MRPAQLISIYLNENDVPSGGGGGGEVSVTKSDGEITLFYPDNIEAGTLGIQRIEIGDAVFVKLSFDITLPGSTTSAGDPLAWNATALLTDLNAPFDTVVTFCGADSGFAIYVYRVSFEVDGSGSGTISQTAGGDNSSANARSILCLQN